MHRGCHKSECSGGQPFKGVVYCFIFFFSLHDCVYGVQYHMYFLIILFFTNFTFIVSRFLLCHLNNWLTESMKPLSQKQAVGSDWLVWAGVLWLAKL